MMTKRYVGAGTLGSSHDAVRATYAFIVTETDGAVDCYGQVVAASSFLSTEFGGAPLTLAMQDGVSVSVMLTRVRGDKADIIVTKGVPRELWP